MDSKIVILECGCKVQILFNALEFDVLSPELVEFKGIMIKSCQRHCGVD